MALTSLRLWTLLAGVALSAPNALAPAWAQGPEGSASGSIRLPSLGEPDVDDLTESAERRLGELIMRSIRRDPAFLDDPQVLAHVQALWQPLRQAARQRGDISPDIDQLFAWSPFLVRDKTMNAFALPGGHVGVHLGLLAVTVQQDELAAVLAHELSHITQRHIARGSSSARRQSMIGLAGLLASILVASRSGNLDVAQAGIVGSQAAVAQGQLNFSRDMEREADRVGFAVLTDAGYSPDGVARMFERMDKVSRLNDSGNYPYLRSHPMTLERLGDARARVRQVEGREASSAPAALPHPDQHQLMRGRARVLMDTTVPALRYWQQLGQSAPAAMPPEERSAHLYAGVLASVLLNEPAPAQAILKTLQAQPLHASTTPALTLLAADVDLVSGRWASAWQRLNTLPRGSREAVMARADAALRWHQRASGADMASAQAALQAATEDLHTWVVMNGQDALAWATLAPCAQALQQPLRSIRAEAESRWALGDLNGALDRFRAGQRMVRQSAQPDHVEASVIDARVRELERERRRTFADYRGIREEDVPPQLPPNVPL